MWTRAKKKKKLGDFTTAIAKPAVCAKVLFSYGALRTAGRINQLGGTLPLKKNKKEKEKRKKSVRKKNKTKEKEKGHAMPKGLRV